jgi:hypothetical protein
MLLYRKAEKGDFAILSSSQDQKSSITGHLILLTQPALHLGRKMLGQVHTIRNGNDE